MEDKGTYRNFYKHSSITANVAIALKGLSDANDTLGISMYHTPPEYKEFVTTIRNENSKLSRDELYSVNIVKPRKSSDFNNKYAGGTTDDPILGVKLEHFKNTHLSECALFLTVQLYNYGKLLAPEMVTKCIRSLRFFEHIIFPITYADLSTDACIGITIYDMNKPLGKDFKGIPIGGTCINLFNKNKCLRQGNYSLYIHPKVEGDPGLYTKTVGLIKNPLISEKNKLYTYIDRHRSGTVKHIKWLDKLTYQTIGKKLSKIDNDSQFATLDVCLSMFDHAVIWKEKKYEKREVFMDASSFEEREENGLNKSNTKKTTIADVLGSTPITLVYDPTVMSRKKEDFLNVSDPITKKYYAMIRNVDEAIARELRPDQEKAKIIEEILAKPDFNVMSDRDVAIIWTYRYFLQNRKDAITKILLSVKWEEEKEEKEALRLLDSWANIDLEQSITMLSYLFSAGSHYQAKTKRSLEATLAIRLKAIAHIETFKDEDLEAILMQLVQAYRYEDYKNSRLKALLIGRATDCFSLASKLSWLLYVETHNASNGEMIKEYSEFLNDFKEAVNSLKNKTIKKGLDAQTELINKLNELTGIIKGQKTKANEKTKKLREMVSRGGPKDMSKFNLVAIPVNPKVVANGVISEKSHVFDSKTNPMKIVFNVERDTIPFTTNNSSEYPVIFKEGDDLRQDQLILQMFDYMNELLKKVSVDLKFSLYRVLATGIKDGFTEFVTESTTISFIKKSYDSKNPIEDFLKKMEKEKKIPYETLLDNYIKSCAGYSAVTYILGIGDRHLENLMMRKDGRLFHIDFGFILGSDPKVFPPPIRICKEMVLAMGGKSSASYKEFCNKCVDAFLYLRKYAKLIVNLFYLMIHAGLKDLEITEAQSILMKLYERFMPDKNEQEAERGFLQLIHESVNAFFPKLMETFHEWAKYWK